MSLRGIVKEHLEEETLRDYFEERYNEISAEEKERILGLVSGEIDRKTETILSTFVEDIQKGSPELKRRKYLKAFLAFITLVSSTGLAFAVNQENISFIIVTKFAVKPPNSFVGI